MISMKIEILTDDKTIFTDSKGALNVKISSRSGNGVYLDSEGLLHLRKGEDGGGGSPTPGSTVNIPGNGIEGRVQRGISIIRCNNSVTRLKQVDGDIPDAIYVDDIVNGILNS